MPSSADRPSQHLPHTSTSDLKQMESIKQFTRYSRASPVPTLRPEFRAVSSEPAIPEAVIL